MTTLPYLQYDVTEAAGCCFMCPCVSSSLSTIIAIVCVVMTCSVAEIYLRFGEGCCQNLHGSTPPSCHLFVHNAVSISSAFVYYPYSRQTTLPCIPEDTSFTANTIRTSNFAFYLMHFRLDPSQFSPMSIFT